MRSLRARRPWIAGGLALGVGAVVLVAAVAGGALGGPRASKTSGPRAGGAAASAAASAAAVADTGAGPAPVATNGAVAGASTGPGASPGATAAASGSLSPRAFAAPPLRGPLPNLDPSLATRGPRPTLAGLMAYQYRDPAVFTNPRATVLDWQLARPNPSAVHGYTDQISVLPGQSVGLHLSGRDRVARVDVFRMGLGDARHVLTIPAVRIAYQPAARPDPATGLVEEAWPQSAVVDVPADWTSGLYLVKLTGASGGQSYIPFIVRERTPQPLTVVLPTMSWQAYNDFGGSDLYAWYGGPHPRAYAVSYDRPFSREAGAGLLFRLDFPLIVWLEDHGYTPGYVADVDLARDPSLAAGARTLIFSGHGEYWTRSVRDNVEAAAAQGTNLAFMGANQAFWQVRLAPDAAGSAGRTIIGYKSAALDPITTSSPIDATTRFQDPPVNRPPSSFMGQGYGGVVNGIRPMIVGAGIRDFAPDLGLREGQQLPGLIADEVDTPPPGFTGILLGATPLSVTEHPGTVTAAAALWIAPTGSRVFDAGTFDFSWGLDPRYSAALPGFPASAYSQLTAEILAWLGAQPTR